MAREPLETQLAQAMQQYSADVKDGIEKALTSVAEQALQKVKAASPARKKNGGSYRKGWRLTKQSKDGTLSFTVQQSKKQARLTHLLEFGHKTVKKSGKYGGKEKTEGIPHIKPVEKLAEKAAIEAVKKAVSG